MGRPRLLDLFCGGGGAGMGYHRAGFDVVGVDINPQPHFPFEFIQADVMGLGVDFLQSFDAIHASPPCQAYTAMQALNPRAPKRDHPKLVEPVRAMLIASGKPYVMENVPGSPLIDPVKLCGSMFDLGVRRHRLFECSFPMLVPQCQHAGRARPIAVYGDHPQQPGDKTYRVNRARNLAEGQEAMGIDWMPWRPLTQSIPPAYTQFIGERLMAHLKLPPAVGNLGLRGMTTPFATPEAISLSFHSAEVADA
jgi:DNA (cytosine-5)-methyltransferase 1